MALLDRFEDPKTPNCDQCSCAYYLGELRAPQAADVLAVSITLELDLKKVLIGGVPLVAYDPAMNALIKIGSPSIPALIRNLTESDSAKVREASLKVLCRIEGEKDIVELRLQKALAAQNDGKKQARIRAAIKALADIPAG
jgi:HEAT repeat protein